jgi:hypothetical protein
MPDRRAHNRGGDVVEDTRKQPHEHKQREAAACAAGQDARKQSWHVRGFEVIGHKSEAHEQPEEVRELCPLMRQATGEIEMRERQAHCQNERQSEPCHLEGPLVENDDPGEDRAK